MKIKLTPEQVRFLKDYSESQEMENGTEILTIPGFFIIESVEYGIVTWHKTEEE